MTAFSNIDSLIRSGIYDDQLNEIESAVNGRKKELAQRQLMTIKPGDIVAISGTVRPKYLAGLRVKVTKVNQKTVSGSFVAEDKVKARRYGNTGVRLPANLMELQ